MLFVSRYVGQRNCAIVDTDDGVEEVVSLREAISAVSEGGLSIKGVFPAGVDYHAMVTPWQEPRSVSKLQTKTWALKRVNVTLYKSSITNIRWCSSGINSPVSIRLSDFGRSCADCILAGWYSNSKEHKVSIILDDKIFISDTTFVKPDASIDGVTFDLREVTDNSIVRSAYRAFAKAAGNFVVLDDPRRQRHETTLLIGSRSRLADL